MVPFRGILPTTVLWAGFLLFKGGLISDKADPVDLRLDNCNVGPPPEVLFGDLVVLERFLGSNDCFNQCSTSFNFH